jgi:translocation and assembly module TamB
LSAAPQFPPDYGQPQVPSGAPRPPARKRALWKTVLGWIGAILGALIILVGLAVFVALRSRIVHGYVLRVAQEKATAALGTSALLGDFGLHFSGVSPVLDLYHVAIGGAAPYSNQPVAQAERLHVAVTVTSLVHRKWYVDDITLVHPVVRVLVDAQGNNNLPKPKSSGEKSNTNVFDLGVRHAKLEGGEVYYNDRKSGMSADLHDVNFLSAYDAAEHAYSGRLSYRDGHLLIENFAPLPHQMDAEFVAGPTAFTLKQAVLRSGASELALSATVEDYASPKVKAQYRASINGGEFRRVLKNPSLPAGVILAAGTLDYASQPDRPLLAVVNVHGHLNSSRLLVEMPSFQGAINALAATYTVANGNLEVPDLRAQLLGGQLTAALSMRDLAGASRSHLIAALRSVSLQSAKSLGNSAAMRQLPVSGRINATADAAWGKTMDDLVARADASINARVAGNGHANPVPLDSSIHAHYDARRKQIGLANSFVHTPQTSLSMNGIVSERSALEVSLRSNDLHELDTLATVIRPGQPPLGLYGSASLNATVTGSTSAPRVAGQLNASNLRVKGTRWRLLRTNLSLNPSQASLQNGELDPAERGRITFSGTVGLKQWAFTETSPFQFSLNSTPLDVAEITRGAGIEAPVSGTLTANVSLHGSQQNPIGQGNISLTRAKIQAEHVDSFNLRFNGTGETVQADLSARLPAGAAKGTVTLHPKQKAYEAELSANGIRLDQLETVKQRNMPLSGVLNFNANGRGTFDNPGFNATLEIPQLTMRNQTISGLKLETALANHVGNFNLRSQVVNTSISGHGTVHLTGDYYADAVLDTQAIPFEPLVAAYAPSQVGNVTGQTELHATVRGPLKQKSQLEAHLTIPTLALNYKNTVQIAAAGPIRVDYVNGVLDMPRAALRGTGTNLEFQGRVPLTTNAPASMLLQGSMDLQLAQMFDPDISSSGQLRFDIDSYGRRDRPNVHGQIRIVNANIATGTVPLGLQDGNGVLTLLEDRLQITQFKGLVGGGDFSASGAVVYRPGVRFDVALSGRDTRMLYNNVRAAFDTKLALAGTMDSAQLNGQVQIAQVQFTPAFDLMDFMGDLGGGASTPPPTEGFAQALELNVGIASTSGVNLVSRTMSLQAAANLRVTGTAAQPVILGRINVNGGDLIFRGNRYVLQGGTVDFVNPSQTQPVVNVSVNTEVQQYNVQMHFWGPADHLHTDYSSDPALPPSDIINLIAFGKTQEASAANPNPPGNLAAEQAVASQVSGQITNRVEKVAGLSQLSVDPLLGGGNQGESPGARVTVQQRVTGKIFVTFSTDVTSTQNSVIKMEYQQSRRVSYSGTRDQNGGFGFDRRIHKEW